MDPLLRTSDIERSPSGGFGGVRDLRSAPSYRNTVMIIDDQSTGRVIMERIVRSVDASIQTQTFSDPLAAIDWARTHPVDLVLTDYKMPQLDGVETIKRIRQIATCADVPIVVVTVMEDREVRYRALAAGASDFLTKPVDQHECRARCGNLLTLRRQQILIRDRAKLLEQQVSDGVREVRLREVETLFRLAKAGEYRDRDTGNHVIRMAKYSRLIAEALGLAEDDCDTIELAAPMHDIGKIGIPDTILLKAGVLDAEEIAIMREHPRIGHEILKDSPSKYLRTGAVIALGHHERFDGSGYPNGFREDDIPLSARIVAVADVFDALTSVRPYKRSWSIGDAVQHLKQQRGLHFDPRCVDAFLFQMDKATAIRDRFTDLPGNPAL
jgi:two-component system, response regulator RpfG